MFQNNTIISQDVVDKMIHILSQHFPEIKTLNPNSNYCIAGGAVYSAFIEAIQLDLTTSYKDLDVFVYREPQQDNDDPHIARKPSNDITTIYSGSFLECRMTSIPKNHYSIMTSTTVNKINTIEIDTNRHSPCDFANMVIGSFDINNVQIALYANFLNVYSVVVSDAFIDFFNDHTLRATNYYTGAHTAVRLVRKAKQLKLNVDQQSLDHCLIGIDIVNHIEHLRRTQMNIERRGTPGWMMAANYQNETKQLGLPIEFEQIECNKAEQTFYLGIPKTTTQHVLSNRLKDFITEHISALGVTEGLDKALNLLKHPTQNLENVINTSALSHVFMHIFVNGTELFSQDHWSKQELLFLDEALTILSINHFAAALERIKEKDGLLNWLEILLKRKFNQRSIDPFTRELQCLQDINEIQVFVNLSETQIENLITTNRLAALEPHPFLSGLYSENVTVLDNKQAHEKIEALDDLWLSNHTSLNHKSTYTIFVYHHADKQHLLSIDNETIKFHRCNTSRYGTVSMIDGQFTLITSDVVDKQNLPSKANAAINLAINQINLTQSAMCELSPCHQLHQIHRIKGENYPPNHIPF
ncbi:hypothetical protein ACP3V3_16760 [Vibrio sp. PNB22_3_1]